MKIKFYSYTPSGNVKFEAEGIQNKNTLSFIDKSFENTTLSITVEEFGVNLERVGGCTMNMHLEIGRKCPGHYKGADLEFDFIAEAKKIEITEEKITLWYELSINSNSYGLYKIFVVKK
ncbi:MAG: DUF1934 domain-containing protein [Acholeplasmatales bacterium]|nr:DUF1934 domain-containing protein [Acholeplasmatales bacterium]